MTLEEKILIADQKDHKEIIKLSKLSRFTKGFADVRYIQEYYSNGWVGKATVSTELVGFVCLRHCIKRPWTTIYYLGVVPSLARTGIGSRLVDWVWNTSPHPSLRLGIEATNADGLAFWTRQGFIPCEHLFTVTKNGTRIYQFECQRKRPRG